MTPNQLQELHKIIDQKITTFVAYNISPDVLSKEEKAVLTNMGIDIKTIQPKDLLIYQSYALGVLSGAVPQARLNDTSYSMFKKYLESGKFIPLNSYEKAVIKSLEQQTYTSVKGIGNKYKTVLDNAIAASQRKYYEDVLKRNIAEGVAKKAQLRTISNDIAKELDGFGRDFDRIVATVSHQAFTEGRTAFIDKNYGEDAEIYMGVYEGSCKKCIEAYLTGGIGSEPKTFKNNELPPPQVNYGKKAKDWVPTQPPLHPYCRCTPNIKPPGYVWDDKKQAFVPPAKYKRKVDRKSKISINFDGKDYSV